MGNENINSNSNSKGCLKLFLVGLGYVAILSSINPFLEWEYLGEDRQLSNLSYFIIAALLFGYTWIIIKYFTDKK
jgi:hypothetical protein